MCKCMHIALDCDCPVACLLLEHCASMRHVAQKMLHKSCHAKVTSALSLQTSLPWPSECCLGLVRVLMKLSELCAHVPEEHVSLQVRFPSKSCINSPLYICFAITVAITVAIILHIDVVSPAPAEAIVTTHFMTDMTSQLSSHTEPV